MLLPSFTKRQAACKPARSLDDGLSAPFGCRIGQGQGHVLKSVKIVLYRLSKHTMLGGPLRSLSRYVSGGHSLVLHLKPDYMAHNKQQTKILAAFEAANGAPSNAQENKARIQE